jgi:secreted PhoX family phosphatase
MTLSRRGLLRAALLSASGLVTPDAILPAFAAMAKGVRGTSYGYGPLVADPQGLLDLPAGFQYRVLSPGITRAASDLGDRFRSTLSNGEPTPGLHDGMDAFAGPDGMTILVRNHEQNLGDEPMVDVARRRPYDVKTAGGTTTLWVNRDRELVKSFPSLSGTVRNCAGGRTPWGSWLTAEETAYIPGERDAVNADMDPGVDQRHGYIFEVDAFATDLVDPIPLKAMGRFRHEAVAVDPATGFAYLTEDRDDGLFYRFRPAVLEHSGKRPSDLRTGDYAKGGVLEALRIVSRPQALTQNHAAIVIPRTGERLAIEWVAIPVPDPDMDMMHPEGHPRRDVTAPTSTRAQGFALGCAQFARTEGIVYARGSVYFCCTNGGPEELGQVFRLDLKRQELSLVVEPDEHAVLDGPDNICLAPNGDLVICEDSLARRSNFVVGVTKRGTCYRIARNAHPSNRELAGACFAPDGRTLFVNIQEPGVTFAIWGPWEKRRG